jgi:hypothetical protein
VLKSLGESMFCNIDGLNRAVESKMGPFYRWLRLTVGDWRRRIEW